MTQELKLIRDYIIEFIDYIKPHLIDKIIENIDLENYTLKFMIKPESMHLLIYKYNLLVYLITIKDKEIIHEEVNMHGIRLSKYLPKENNGIINLENNTTQIKVRQDSLTTELGIDYDNKLSVGEKLNLLQTYIDDNPVVVKINKRKNITTKVDDKRKVFSGVKGRAYTKHKEYVDTIKHLPLDEYENLWKEYIKINKKK